MQTIRRKNVTIVVFTSDMKVYNCSAPMSQSATAQRVLCTAMLSFLSLSALAEPSESPPQALPQGESAEAQPARTDLAEKNPQLMETVEVRGQRASNTQAVADKRSTAQIMDAISADDTRQLPDTTVAETVRRIPGVSVTFNNDNVHGRDEAERPVIRGLDARYNNSTLDGAPLASPDANNFTTGAGSSATRGARLDLLPTSMIQRLEVFKSWTPDLDPNAVGGSVNIATRSAFANGGNTVLDVNAALGHVSDHGKPFSDDSLPRRADGTFATTFGGGRFGVVLAADYQKIDTDTFNTATTDTVYYNWYTTSGAKVIDPAQSNGYAIPQNFKHFWFQDSRERQGYTLKLEAKPVDSLYTYVSAGRYEAHQVETRNENFLSITASGTPTPTAQTASSGSFGKAEAEVGYLNGPIDRATQMLQLGGDWHLSEDRVLSLHYSDSRATFNENTPMVKYIFGTVYNAASSPGTAARPGLAFNYDTSGFAPSFALQDPSQWTHLQNWTGFYWRQVLRQSHNKVDDTRLDYRQNLDPGSQGPGFALGFAFRDNSYHFNYDQSDYYPTTAALTLADAYRSSGLTVPASGGLPYLTIDGNAAWRLFNTNPSLFRANAAGNIQNSLQDDYTYDEKIKAGYAMVGYNIEKWHGLMGFRYDRADVEATAWQKVTSQANGLSWQPVLASSEYHNILPSALLTYDVTGDLKARFAATRTIGRPDYGYYAPRASTVENPDGTLTINNGNPNIQPRRSTNLDASFEWYLGRSGMLSAALFNKQIKNEIYVANLSNQQVPYADGTVRTATLSTPENAADARMRGVELTAIVNSFDFVNHDLANLGLSTNYTLLQGRFGVVNANGTTREIDRMLGQPNYIWNVTLFYTPGPADLRLAWNHTGSSLRAVDTSGYWQDVFWKDRQQLDFSARYRMPADCSLFFEATNLTREPVTSLTGPNRNLLKDTYIVGRTFWAGITWTPAF
jgi:iron complex outermembrane recepter protein